VNHARRDNPALQSNERLHFHHVDNDQILFYSKHSEDRSNIVLVAVNLDPFHQQGGSVHLSLEPLGIGDDESYQVLDLLTGASYAWRGADNYVQLDPSTMPAHLFVLQRTDPPSETWLP